MVRSELESKLAEQNPNILRKDIEKIVDTILIEISEALAKGKNIEIRGFGSYKVKIRKARTGRNPKNSKTHEPDKTVSAVAPKKANAPAGKADKDVEKVMGKKQPNNPKPKAKPKPKKSKKN